MQAQAREKMRAVLEVNVHKQPVVQSVHYKSPTCTHIPEQFDVVTTVFCLEYASETLEEYSGAVKNATTLIKPGGFLVSFIYPYKNPKKSVVGARRSVKR